MQDAKNRQAAEAKARERRENALSSGDLDRDDASSGKGSYDAQHTRCKSPCQQLVTGAKRDQKCGQIASSIRPTLKEPQEPSFL